MGKETKMARVHVRMDNLMDRMAREMKITKTDASYLIAVQLRPPVVKKGRKRFMVSL